MPYPNTVITVPQPAANRRAYRDITFSNLPLSHQQSKVDIFATGILSHDVGNTSCGPFL